jgi:hypothetical protein
VTVGVGVSVGVGVAVRVGVSVAVGVEVGVRLGVPVAVGDAVGVEVGLGEAIGGLLSEGVTGGGVGSDPPHPAADSARARTRTVATRFQALVTPSRLELPGQGKALIPSPDRRSPPGDPSRTESLRRVKVILQR